MVQSVDAPSPWVRRLDWIGLAATSIGAATLLAYVLGSVFTGGRLAENMSYLFANLVEWPLFRVDPWFTITISSIAFLCFVPLAALAGPAQVDIVTRASGFTASGALALPLLLMYAFPKVAPGSLPFRKEQLPSEHWIAVLIGLVTFVLIQILNWRAMRVADQYRRRTGRLPANDDVLF